MHLWTKGAFAVLLPLLPLAAAAQEPAGVMVSAEAFEGWATASEGAPPSAPEPEGALPFDGIVLPPRTAVRLEAGGVAGAAVRPFLGTTLRVQVLAGPDVAFGLALPLVLATDNPAVAGSGAIALERSWRTGSGAAPQQGLVTVRLLLPAATNPRWFNSVPGRSLEGAGLEGGYALRHRGGPFTLHLEAGAGLYSQPLMPLRFSATAVGAWQAWGPLHLLAQLDPWVVWVPAIPEQPEPWIDEEATAALGQLGLGLGAELRLGSLTLSLAYQRVLNHADDHHLWLGVDLPLRRD